MLTLDAQFSDLKREVKALEAGKLHLQAKVHPLERDIKQLEHQIHEMQSKAAHDNESLDEMTVTLLQAMPTVLDRCHHQQSQHYAWYCSCQEQLHGVTRITDTYIPFVGLVRWPRLDLTDAVR